MIFKYQNKTIYFDIWESNLRPQGWKKDGQGKFI